MWQPWQGLRLLARKTLKVAKNQTLAQIGSVFNIAKLVKTTFQSALKLRVILQSTIRSASTTTSKSCHLPVQDTSQSTDAHKKYWQTGLSPTHRLSRAPPYPISYQKTAEYHSLHPSTHGQTTYNGITRPSFPCLPPSMHLPFFPLWGVRRLSKRLPFPSFLTCISQQTQCQNRSRLKTAEKMRKRDSLTGTQANKREVDKVVKQVPRAKERGEVRGLVLRSVCGRYSSSRELK